MFTQSYWCQLHNTGCQFHITGCKPISIHYTYNVQEQDPNSNIIYYVSITLYSVTDYIQGQLDYYGLYNVQKIVNTVRQHQHILSCQYYLPIAAISAFMIIILFLLSEYCHYSKTSLAHTFMLILSAHRSNFCVLLSEYLID